MASDSKAKILREGERYVQQGKISLAINEYLKIIKTDPDDVLTLNTIGDLYLRQGRVADANRLFFQVAENYARNNFLLKSIAVYKKVLNSEPQNMEVNLLLATLYARQGMNIDARSQYMHVAELCSREGKTQESLEAYEKVVEIDPMNSPIHLKLATTFLSQGVKDKAHHYFIGAARAQAKASDTQAAMGSFRRALEINPVSSDALKGFFESALQAGDVAAGLNQLQNSIGCLPDDPALRELLARVYLAAGDMDRAEQQLRMLIEGDETHCDQFFPLSQAFLESGSPDRAIQCLDPIVPILISRRETGKVVEAYERVLDAYPDHVATMMDLAEILSATNDNLRYVAVLERIAQHYQDLGNYSETLTQLEKILQLTPDSQKHLKQHREAFQLAFPDTPYRLPRAVVEVTGRHAPHHLDADVGPSAVEIPDDDAVHSTLVEIDLLLNYGMKDKALQLLIGLESKTPIDKGVRSRLATLYRETGETRLAAEQCVLLSVLHHKAGDLEAEKRALGEAKSLASDWLKDLDVTAFAQKRGVKIEPPKAKTPVKEPGVNLEVDLSGDLSEIFFSDSQEAPELDHSALEGVPDAIVDEFPRGIPHAAAPESIEEQLQEVDFYIRLGFHDEARTKLDEIAAARPDHPELADRYGQLNVDPSRGAEPIALAPPQPGDYQGAAAAPEPAPIALPPLGSPKTDKAEARPGDLHQPVLDLEAAAGHFGENKWFDLIDGQRETVPPVEGAAIAPPMPVVLPGIPPAGDQSIPEFSGNSMFADLIEEVNSLTDQEIAQEDFETHFSLGIAYREMGLTEEAIKEFQSAVKALNSTKRPKEIIQCCGMLSTCFLEKGMPRSAIRWCQTGLGMQVISSHEAMALRYDMGVAHVAAGDSDRALDCFNMIFGIDPSYRDVAQRIDDLKSGLERHAP